MSGLSNNQSWVYRRRLEKFQCLLHATSLTSSALPGGCQNLPAENFDMQHPKQICCVNLLLGIEWSPCISFSRNWSALDFFSFYLFCFSLLCVIHHWECCLFFCLTWKAQLKFERARILSLINYWWDLFAIVYTNLVKWSCAKSFYFSDTSFLCGHALPPTHPPKAATFAFSLQKCKSSMYWDSCSRILFLLLFGWVCQSSWK